MFLWMNKTRIQIKILIVLDFENGFLPTYLPLCILVLTVAGLYFAPCLQIFLYCFTSVPTKNNGKILLCSKLSLILLQNCALECVRQIPTLKKLSTAALNCAPLNRLVQSISDICQWNQNTLYRIKSILDIASC